MFLICLFNHIMNVGTNVGTNVGDECWDQCGDSFTVVNFKRSTGCKQVSLFVVLV